MDEVDDDPDKFNPIKVKELSGFNVVKHKQYGTTSIYVVDKDLKTRPCEKKYYAILGLVKMKYGDQKANVRLQSPALVYDFKNWETLIKGALEILGFPHVTFIWGNMMYPKTKLLLTTQPKSFILKNVFINKEGKAYPQLWLE